MGELMSSLSLLFAVWGVLFGLWNKEINACISAPIPPGRLGLIAARDENKKVIMFRALPLLWGAILLFVIFIPETIGIIANNLSAYKQHGLAWLQNYYAVKTAFCAVNILSLIFAVIMYKRIRLLLKHLHILENNLAALNGHGDNGD